MADSSMQNSVNKHRSMENLDKIIENALQNNSNSYSSTAMDDSAGNVAFSPSVSLSHSILLEKQFNPTTISSNSKVGNYQLSGIHESCQSQPYSRPYYQESNHDTKIDDKVESVIDKYRVDAMRKEMSESCDQWVDYQFNRLITDRKVQQKPTQSKENKLLSRYDGYDNQNHSKPKKIEEIIGQYSIQPAGNSANTSSLILPNSCRFASAANDRQYRSVWMNRSHNNESLDRSNSEAEQVRRIGSSVDGKVVDASDTLNQKCSLTNGRCRTPVSSSMQLHTSVSEDYKDYKKYPERTHNDYKKIPDRTISDYKKFPERAPSDSEVDSKDLPTQPSANHNNEVRSELADLGNFFQKEMDRFRHIETLFRKTPVGSSNSGTAAFLQPKLSSRYSSRFLTDLTERRAYSSTDYTNRYVTADWRSSSPNRDYIGRTKSSPSYKNFTTTTMPRSNYWSDFNAMQQVNTGYEMNRGRSTNSHTPYETEMGKHGNYHYQNATEPQYNSKSKLNRSMNAKKEKNPSKTSGSKKHRQKSSTRPITAHRVVTSRQQKELEFDQSENKQQTITCDYLQDAPFERYDSLPISPSTSSSSSKDVVPKRKHLNKQREDTRYKSYQPMNLDCYFPQRAKSECSSLEMVQSCNAPQINLPENNQYKWHSILMGSSANPSTNLPTSRYDERMGRPKEPCFKHFEDVHEPRSISGGHEKPLPQAWINDNPVSIQMPKAMKSTSQKRSSSRKKIVRKAKGVKPKRVMGRSVSRHKKKLT